ncbi:MAG: formylmethanofuran dehydrogenase subunit E family protein [Syntrophorhabdales bacterium]|jgi:formylmethanofuran dehydrogenase subunit E
MAANILSYTYEEYIERVRAFHSYAAPGVLIGGFMVDMAYRHLPEKDLYDALCETPKCLPDAVQLLTPCTVGNGWLTVINLGRFALSLYNKSTGKGVRVYIDPSRLDGWPEIKSWFFKSRAKKEQDKKALLDQIGEAAGAFLGLQRVEVAGRFMERHHRGTFAVCPGCAESYPAADGALCLGCQGMDPYVP